jgi:uridine phosphorylase
VPGRLRPTAAIAPDALLPVDPGLSLALAQSLLVKPLMSNHSHGLWGYSGRTHRGHELTIQATGIGGPSAAIVLGELAALGTRRAIRLGPCAAIDPGLSAGDGIVVETAIGADGVSAVLDRDPRPAEALLRTLLATAGPAGVAGAIVSADLEGELAPVAPGDARAAGAAAADLETAAVLAAGARLGLTVAALVVVATDARGVEDAERTDSALLEFGAIAARALEPES